MSFTIILALLGWGFWALIAPKVLVVPVWVVVYRRYHQWRPKSGFSLAACRMEDWRDILQFSLPVTGVEVLSTLRSNMDYLLVGYLLGIEALGVYFFAFNAGLGISISLINSLGNAFFPHLCDVNQNQEALKKHFWNGLKLMGVTMIPLIILQASMAPLYLPFVFGEKWVHAGALPILIMICLSALPRPFAEASSQLLRAVGRPQSELRANIALTSFLFISLIIGLNWGINGIAAGVLIAHLLVLPPYSIWAYQCVWKKTCLKYRISLW